MIIEPVHRGHLYVTAHPDGCAAMVREWVAYARGKQELPGPARALVIGASTGLGLASRVTAGFGAGAATVGVCLERPGGPRRTATPGWYNTAAYHAEAERAGLYARTVVGDAFADETRHRTVETIARDLGQVDLVVYSIAAPRRVDPVTGELYQSVLKTIHEPYRNKAFHAATGTVVETTTPPATDDEIRQTVAVMGGDDWQRWIEALAGAGLLAPGATTIAYSYIGGDELAPTYRGGTIGRAKLHLEATAAQIDRRLGSIGGRAYTAVMKALVTHASLAIPMSALYTILLIRVMRERGLHEGPIEQVHRLFADRLYHGAAPALDAAGRIRLDDRELRADVQAEVRRRWRTVTTESLAEVGALDEFLSEVARLNGFGRPDVHYGRDISPVREIPGLIEVDPAKRQSST
ncbi:enoyl-ACP reductase FabV [Micromonospora sp. KC721]|uniref:enoyl-ACP reductase FabV n=1 Tax=Micromonospora sp. KC721 TaxID=2530380 RepID=UPI0010531FAF|nr:enoyl-ACP reductase FabV [Micromonospora sp. KC721]TDB81878.1 trans-2-enoyl-CoA reductase family protein [Micromonospora sp. KC721]